WGPPRPPPRQVVCVKGGGGGGPLWVRLPRPLAGVFFPASQPAVSRFVTELLQRFISRRRLYHVEVFHPLRNCLLVLSCAGSLAAQSFNAPAGIRSAQRRPTGAILPGGRIIQPEGEQFLTGSGPFGLEATPERSPSSIGAARRPTGGGAPSTSIRRATTTATPAIWRWIANAACSTWWIRPTSASL